MARSNFNSLIPTCLMSYTDIIREFRSDVKPFFGMHYLYFSFFKGGSQKHCICFRPFRGHLHTGYDLVGNRFKINRKDSKKLRIVRSPSQPQFT